MMVWVAGILFCMSFLVGMSVMEVVVIMVIVDRTLGIAALAK